MRQSAPLPTLVVVWLAIAACQPSFAQPLTRYAEEQPHMGTAFEVVVYASGEATAKRALTAAHQRAAELDAMLSDYRRDSELSRLSRAAPTEQPIQVSDDLYQILARGQQISRASEGAFDVTVGPVVRLWRRARRRGKLPAEDRLQAARAAVGYHLLALDSPARTVSLRGTEMRLDLGGIAKGYAAQAMLDTLRANGVERALVNAGGDIAVSQPPPDAAGWKIAVMPLGASSQIGEWIQVADACVATSGDAWQFVEIEGQRFSHIVDPRTGVGTTRRGGVTVVAADGATSDALASALSVLDTDHGLQLVKQFPGAAARIVWMDSDQLREARTENFPPLQRQ